MLHRRNNWKSIALLVVASVVACSAVAGAQTWSTPQFIANGFGIAVATSTWSTPVTPSSLGPFGSGTGNIAVAPNGDVLAVWSFRTTNTYIPNQAQAAFFTAGHWGSAITISTNVYGNVNSFGLPGTGFDSHSQATLIDEEITNPSPIACALKARTGSAASGFGSAQTISNATTCYGLAKLDVNSGGEAVAVEGATGILTGPVIAISRSLTGTWGAPVTEAASAYRQNNPNVGLGNEGTAVVVWRTRSGVSYAVRSGGTWSAAAGLPVLAGQAGGSTGVAVDGAGNAVAIFTQVTLSPGTYATYRPVGGSWQTKVQLSSGVPVAATPAGTFVASGTTVSTRLAGTSNWTTHTFSGTATVNAGPGLAIAVVGPQVSISTAAVP
jgi:hypothetical protein